MASELKHFTKTLTYLPAVLCDLLIQAERDFVLFEWQKALYLNT